MKKLSTAVFGTGFVGRVHIEGIHRLGNVEVYAIGVGPEDDAALLSQHRESECSSGVPAIHGWFAAIDYSGSGIGQS